MAHLTNFSFEFFYKIFTEDASLPLLYHGAKKSKMTKNSNQGGGGPALKVPWYEFETVDFAHNTLHTARSAWFLLDARAQHFCGHVVGTRTD